MQKMALLVCLMACSAAPDTNTECSATLSCAGNFQIGCNAYEAIDHRMSQTRAWIIEFPDGGPIYTVTGNQIRGRVLGHCRHGRAAVAIDVPATRDVDDRLGVHPRPGRWYVHHAPTVRRRVRSGMRR